MDYLDSCCFPKDVVLNTASKLALQASFSIVDAYHARGISTFELSTGHRSEMKSVALLMLRQAAIELDKLFD